VDFIRSQPRAAATALARYTPIPKDIEKQVLADLKLFKYCKLGEENRLNVQRFADFCLRNKIIDKPIQDVNVMFADYVRWDRADTASFAGSSK
jgi:ABC-type nitrate/sulfonate/bicarbonate transport system substrate-binding protein